MESIVKDRDKSTLESYFDRGARKLKGIFNISLGVIFPDYRKKSILFANEYFHSILKDKERDVLDNIYGHFTEINYSNGWNHGGSSTRRWDWS